MHISDILTNSAENSHHCSFLLYISAYIIAAAKYGYHLSAEKKWFLILCVKQNHSEYKRYFGFKLCG